MKIHDDRYDIMYDETRMTITFQDSLRLYGGKEYAVIHDLLNTVAIQKPPKITLDLTRIFIFLCGVLLAASPGMSMEQQWIDDLNARFPNIGNEFQDAVQQKLTQYGDNLTISELIARLESHPEYSSQTITNTRTFGLHSELMVLYPGVGNYQKALMEAKLLRDFVLAYPPDDPQVIVTFRGVYTELLILNERYEEALQECEETLVMAPDEEGIYLSQGVANAHLGYLDKALENLRSLLQKPDSKNYAQQLFDFILTKREAFQEANVQPNTLIDVMLKELEPEHRAQVRIPAALQPPKTTPTPAAIEPSQPSPQRPQKTDTLSDPLTDLIHQGYPQLIRELGTPISEHESETTIEHEYRYHGHTLSIGFEKETLKILSLQMFFLPPVDEIEAFARLGITWRDLAPLVETKGLKVWSPYGPFSKIRLSLNNDRAVAIIVEP